MIEERQTKVAPKVLMVGPGLKVMGGISSVVQNYYKLDLDKQVQLRYISSMKDGNRLQKGLIACIAYLHFCLLVKEYDIVHIHMAAQASFYRKSLFIRKAFNTGKRIVIHQHAADFDEFYSKQVNKKTRKTIQKIFTMADQVIVLSEEWKDFFSNYICDNDKITILHNTVILPSYVKENYHNHYVLFLGRLGKRKGIYDLLEAIPLILKQVPDAHFYFGGDGEIDLCRKIAQKNGFLNHTSFLGWLGEEQKVSYLKHCSIFILPSHYEGMPMSVLEAMSYGLAVVSSNAGGIPQIIEDGVDGYRIHAGDIQEISYRLITLMQNTSLKKEIGCRGREKVIRKFDAQDGIQKLCYLYFSLWRNPETNE